MATSAAAVGGLVSAAVEAYAEYQQLVGGVETLFKESADEVQAYANIAYKTAGMSANQYMETVTGFSASLLQGLGGDTKKATEYANMAIIDMSDNANKMGTSIEAIQVAYQGFAKQNYTMLDNLKLGYGGTKTEMERLIEDANKVKQAHGEMADLSIERFSDVIEAIHIIQEELGIAGTTAEEAATTIEGSFKAVNAAWQNLLVEFGKEDGDIKKNVDILVETATTAFDNLMPVVENAISGVGTFVEQISPLIAEKLPGIISDIGPKLIAAAAILASGVIASIPTLIAAIFDSIMSQDWKGIGTTILGTIEQGLNDVSQTNWSDVGKRILAGITSAFTNITGWATAIFTLAKNAIASVEWAQAGETAFDLVKSAFTGIFDWFNATFLPGPDGIIAVDWVGAGTAILGAIGQGLGGIIDAFKGFFKPAISAITSTELNWASVGTRILGLIGGAFGAVGEWFTALFGPAVTALTGAELNWASAGSGIITSITGGIGDPSTWATELFGAAKTAIIDGIPWAEVGTAIDTAITGAGSALSHIAGEITGFFNDAATSIQGVDWASVGSTVWSTIRGAFSGVRDWFGARFETAKTAILGIEWNELGGSVMSLITSAFTGVGDTLKGFFDSAFQDIQAINWPALGTTIRTNILTGLSSIIDQTKLFFDGAKAKIAAIDWKAAGDDLRGKIETGVEAIQGFISGLFGKEKDDTEALGWKGLGESISSLIQEGLNGLDGFLSGLLGENEWQALKDEWQEAIEWVEKVTGIAWEKEQARLEDERQELRESLDAVVNYTGNAAELYEQYGLDVAEGMSAATKAARDFEKDFGVSVENAQGEIGAIETVISEFVTEYGTNEVNIGADTRNAMSNLMQISEMFFEFVDKYGDIDTFAEFHADDAENSLASYYAQLSKLQEDYWGTIITEGEFVTNSIPVIEGMLEQLALLKSYDGEYYSTQYDVITNYVTAYEGTVQSSKTTEYSSDGTIVVSGGPSKKNGFQEVTLNARSMFGGTILKGATFFGWDDQGRAQIGGGEGPEAVVGVGSLNEQIREAVKDGLSGFLNGIAGAMKGDDRPIYVVLDTGTLVGAMGAKMDSELGKIGDWKGGGRA